jgi:hypothetical protein
MAFDQCADAMRADHRTALANRSKHFVKLNAAMAPLRRRGSLQR